MTTAAPISGHTRVIAHIGVPTGTFRAPLIYNPYFAHAGVDCVVVPMGCEAEDLAAFLPAVARLRNFAGALITMPHKQKVLELLDEIGADARICGACNAVRRGPDGRLIGDMFDGTGFVRGVRRKGRNIDGASALVVGCGGVGSAIAAALAGERIARLGLHDADPAAASRLAERLMCHYPALKVDTGEPDPAGWDIVTNATPLGTHADDPLPVDARRLDPAMLVGEVVLGRDETALVAAARARGCDTLVGADMLFEMIPPYLEFFGLPTTTPDVLRRLAQKPA